MKFRETVKSWVKRVWPDTAYRKERRGLRVKLRRLRDLRPELRLCERLAAGLPAGKAWVSVGLHLTQLPGALLFIYPADLRAEVVPLLREFAQAGYRHYEDRPTADTDARRVTWGLRREKEGHVRITLSAMLQSGGLCRFEQTGTKEVPVYTVVCSDGTRVDDIAQSVN